MSRKLALFSRRKGAHREPVITLPVRAASLAEAHQKLAEQHYYAERYKLARRHYRLALRIGPASAEARRGLARAWEDDPYGSDEHAFTNYRRAAKLDGRNAILLAALGRSAARIHCDQLARRALATAMRLAPSDAQVLAIVLEACREAGWSKRGWMYICRARFLAPESAAIRELWNRARFDRAVQRTPKVKETRDRNVIPFLRIAGEDGVSHWRLDAM